MRSRERVLRGWKLGLYLLPLVTLMVCAETPAGKSVARPVDLSTTLSSGDRYMGVKLLGALNLSGDPAIAELSGLAWDEDEEILYAVSDRGYLLRFKALFRDGLLHDLRLQQTAAIKQSSGQILKGRQADSEGLNLINSRNGVTGDTELLISMERVHRVIRTTPQGRILDEQALPAPMNRDESFRSPNRGVEGFVLHPRLGGLYAPESPLRGERLIRLSSDQGLHWFLPRIEPDGSVVALENAPQGSLLVMERAVTTIFQPWTITLYRVFPDHENAGQSLEPEVVARFNSAEGWLMQNMEGLTALPGSRYMMVSDDGGTLWQSTQLLLFELLD